MPESSEFKHIKRSKRGTLYLSGKGVTLFFSHKPLGFIITVVSGNGDNIGYVLLHDEDLIALLDERAEFWKLRSLLSRGGSVE